MAPARCASVSVRLIPRVYDTNKKHDTQNSSACVVGQKGARPTSRWLPPGVVSYRYEEHIRTRRSNAGDAWLSHPRAGASVC